VYQDRSSVRTVATSCGPKPDSAEDAVRHWLPEQQSRIRQPALVVDVHYGLGLGSVVGAARNCDEVIWRCIVSKARQIYYNAVFGAIGGLLGWLVVGSINTGGWNIWLAYALVGAGVGLFIGGMVGAVEGVVIKQSAPRAALGVLAGGAAGLISGLLGLLLGEAVFLLLGGGLAGRSLGWLLLGSFLGIGEGAVNRSPRRIYYGGIGGTLAGAVGGILYEGMTQAFLQRSDTVQMVVGALGLILIGACLGSIIPLTIFVAARGTLYVRSGARKDLAKEIIDAVTLGSYDGCEVYLPGDPAIEKKHARIYRKGGQFFIEDLSSRSGTFVDGIPLPPGSAMEIKKGAKVRLGSTMVELA